MTLLATHIVTSPKIKGGDPCIEGTRIAVHRVVISAFRLDYSPEEIAEMYDLTLGQVHAALSYYYDHREEIDAIIAEEEDAYEAGLNAQRASKAAGEEYVTAEAAAALLGVKHSSRRIAALCREGKLDCQKVANRWIVSRASIDRYRASNPGPGRPPNEE